MTLAKRTPCILVVCGACAVLATVGAAQEGILGGLFKAIGSAAPKSQPGTTTTSTPAAAKVLSAEFYYDFRGGRIDRNAFTLEGPPEQFKPEAAGLRLTLPASKERKPEFLNVRPKFRLRGDFEITMGYELVKVDKPANPANVRMGLFLEQVGPTDQRQGLAAERNPHEAGGSVVKAYHRGIGADGKQSHQVKSAPSTANKGRLRVVRRGGTVNYLHALDDSSDFKGYHQIEFGVGDILWFHVTANRDQSTELVDVRLLDLMVRAESMPGMGVVVVTMNDERIMGAPKGVEGGKLLLASSPPREIPIDEVVRIDFNALEQLNVKWIGQDGADRAQASTGAGGNGVQDIHLSLTGLTPRVIKQIEVTYLKANAPTNWRLDPSQSSSWRLAIERIGLASKAELYLDPPSSDAKNLDFQATVTYDDGSSARAQFKGETSTNGNLKVAGSSPTQPAKVADAKTPAAKEGTVVPAKSAKEEKPVAKPESPKVAETKPTTKPEAAPATNFPRVTLALAESAKVTGELLSIAADHAKVKTQWGKQPIDIPLLRLNAIRFSHPRLSDMEADLQARIRSPGDADTAFLLAKDDKLTSVTGNIVGFANGKLEFNYEGQTRSILQGRILALVLASHPSPKRGVDPYQFFEFANGDSAPGSLTSVEGEALVAQFPWGTPFQADISQVNRLFFRNGKMVFLSDLDPVSVEETAYFSRKWEHRKDRTFSDDTLTVKGRIYPKGLATHSRTLLGYALDGQFAEFRGIVGFEESVKNHGRVQLRVRGDNKDLLVKDDFKFSDEPIQLKIPVTGVRQLTLEVDFGEDEDIGDRVIWGDARLFR